MMDVVQQLGGGFLQVLYPPYLLLIIAGVAIGMIAGVLPGITGIMVLILMLPLAYKMAAIPALIFLTGAYIGGAFGGTITAILFNIPGDPDSVPSLWDGHPMARAGEAGKALGIAAFSAVIGGLAGAVVLTRTRVLFPMSRRYSSPLPLVTHGTSAALDSKATYRPSVLCDVSASDP